MATMRAVVFSETGPSSVLRLQPDVPKPSPQPTQLLVKIEWAGINFIDTYQRSGLYPVSLPFTTAIEGAGVIEAVGADVPPEYGFAVGDRVALFGGSGCAAEYATVGAGRAVKLPADVSTRDGAALLLQGLTAWTLARDAHEVKPGEVVLVQSAAGGTGGLLVQVAKHLGATVIGTASTAEKAEVARRNGCDHVIVYTEKDFLAEVMEITKGEGCHAVFSGVGQETFEKDLAAVRRKGTFVTYGNASGPIEELKPLLLSKGNVKLVRPTLFNYVTTREEWVLRTGELMDLVAKGALKVAVGGEYALSEMAKAHDELTSKKTTGKLVVKIGS